MKILASRNNQQMQSAAAGEAVFEVSTPDFEERVIRASMETPVLVDFWAPWCGPCKQLMPLLEAAVKEAGGKVLLAKVNIDNNPELAQALRVQSVPTVYAFFQGRPVTAFAGLRPASEIRALIDQLVQMAHGAQPEALDIPETLAQAAQQLTAGDLQTAQQLYAAVLSQDENNDQAYAGLIRTLIAAGMKDQAQQMLEEAPETMKNSSHLAAVRSALELAALAPSGNLADLQRAVEKDPADYQSRFDLALSLFAAGQKGAAIDALVEIVRRNRGWEDEKARHQLLKFFEALGPADPETASGRRKLSAVLFS